MNSDNWAWHYALYVFATLFVRACSSDSYKYAGEAIPLARCERNIPVYHIIPAALLPSGSIVPIQSLSPVVLPTLKREARQRQSSIVQQVVVNQNANQQTIPITIGGLDSGFGDGFDGGRRPFFSRPSFGRGHRFGHSFGRSYAEPEGSSTANQIPAPPCSSSYIISCQPRLALAPCSNAESGGSAVGTSY